LPQLLLMLSFKPLALFGFLAFQVPLLLLIAFIEGALFRLLLFLELSLLLGSELAQIGV
jgi:hypothetical protein